MDYASSTLETPEGPPLPACTKPRNAYKSPKAPLNSQPSSVPVNLQKVCLDFRGRAEAVDTQCSQKSKVQEALTSSLRPVSDIQ